MEYNSCPCVRTIYRIVQLGPRQKYWIQNAYGGLPTTNKKPKKTYLAWKNVFRNWKNHTLLKLVEDWPLQETGTNWWKTVNWNMLLRQDVSEWIYCGICANKDDNKQSEDTWWWMWWSIRTQNYILLGVMALVWITNAGHFWEVLKLKISKTGKACITFRNFFLYKWTFPFCKKPQMCGWKLRNNSHLLPLHWPSVIMN